VASGTFFGTFQNLLDPFVGLVERDLLLHPASEVVEEASGMHEGYPHVQNRTWGSSESVVRFWEEARLSLGIKLTGAISFVVFVGAHDPYFYYPLSTSTSSDAGSKLMRFFLTGHLQDDQW